MGRCGQAVPKECSSLLESGGVSGASEAVRRSHPHLKNGEQLMPNDYRIHVAWAIVLECMDQKKEALERLQHAARLQATSVVYQWLGLLYGEMGRLSDAGAALELAVQLDRRSGNAHSALG